MPHFLLVCGDASRPVGIVIMEAPSMLQAYTIAMALDLAEPVSFGEVHELNQKMMTSVAPTQIGKMISGMEAARTIVRLVEGRGKTEELTDRFPRPWRIVEHSGSFTVQDATGKNLAWFYFENDPGIAPSAAMLFKDDARRRAMKFAGPPSLAAP
jgi:hypothetical protein